MCVPRYVIWQHDTAHDCDWAHLRSSRHRVCLLSMLQTSASRCPMILHFWMATSFYSLLLPLNSDRNVIMPIAQVPIILATSLRSVMLVFTLAGIIGFVINFLLVAIAQWQSVRTCHVMWSRIEARLARAKAHEDQFGIGEDAWSTSTSNVAQSHRTHATCCALGTATTMFSSGCISSRPSAIVVALISLVATVIACSTSFQNLSL